MAYDIKVRASVKNYLDYHGYDKKSEASKIFNITVRTIDYWLKRLREGESLERAVKTDYSVQLKCNFEDIKRYFAEHEDGTLKTAGEYFKVSDVTILNYFKKNNYSYKKNRFI